MSAKIKLKRPIITKTIQILTMASLLASPLSLAAGNPNGGGQGNQPGGPGGGNNNNGNPGCQNGCTGNNGNGVGNTGPGNQGNTGSNGNAGGGTTGTPGDNGNNGNPGNNGNNGNPGDNGNNGNPGNNGNNGNPGDNGNNGNPGDNGNNGNPGDNGNNGNPGDNGNNGNPGDNGNNGNPGDNGNNGDPGDNGNNGDPGDNGNNGDNGDNGNNGDNGDNGNNNNKDKRSNGNKGREQRKGHKPERKTQPRSSKSDDKKSKKLKARVIPLPYLDLDFSSKIVNLAPQQVSQANRATTLSLQASDGRAGYSVLEKGFLTAGLGVSVSLYVQGATGAASKLGAMVGVLPLLTRKFTQFRYAPTHQAAQKATIRRIPESLADLSTWATGDILAYETGGGLALMAGMGLPFVGVGAAYILQGNHIYQVQKLSDTTVFLTISKQKIRTSNVYAFAGIGTIFYERSKTLSEVPSFVMDLSTQGGYSAYMQAIRGNLINAQELGALSNSGVTLVSDAEYSMISRMSKTYLGLPIFFNRSTADGNIVTEESLYSHLSKASVRHRYTEYSQTTTTGGVLSRHFLNRKSILTTTAKDLSEVQISGLWSIERENASDERLARWTQQLRYVGEELDFPAISVNALDRGYAHIEMKFSTGNTGVAKMADTSNASKATLENQVLSDVRRYLAEGDVDNLCPTRAMGSKTNTFQVKVSGSACEMQLWKQSSEKLAQISNILYQTKVGMSMKDSGRVSQSLQQLGKLVLANRFTTQQFIRWARATGATTSSMTVEGENFAKVQLAK